MSSPTKPEQLIQQFQNEDRFLALAESCTGGMLCERITAVPGASNMLLEGIVCYSNASKSMRLGVDPEIIEEHGAVSEETAIEMAKGAYIVPNITDALSITGIAGPSGGTEEKPVGTVWFAFKSHGEPMRTEKNVFDGNRTAIREQSTEFALSMLHGTAD